MLNESDPNIDMEILYLHGIDLCGTLVIIFFQEVKLLFGTNPLLPNT